MPAARVTAPEVGARTPATMRKNVVLPAPSGPISANISPRGTSSVTPASAVVAPKRRVRADVVITAS